MKDLIIVGGGPGGLSAAIYAKRANLDLLVIEKEMPCSKLLGLSKIENYPGVRSINGGDLAMSFFKQIKELDIELDTDTVSKIEKEDNYFKIYTTNHIYESKFVILATGISFNKSFPILDEYLNKGVSTCVTCDGAFYKDKQIIYIGSNQDDINYLNNITNKLIIFNDINSLDIKGDEKVESVIINNKEYEVDAIFVERSFTKSSIELPAIDKVNNFIKVDNNKESSVKGLYAVGDISNGLLKQIVTATADGAIAATDIIKKRHQTK